MANFLATVTLIDSMNTEVTKRYETETPVLATAQGVVAGLVTDLLAISDLGIVAVTYSVKDDQLAVEGELDANVDVGATFRCRLDDGRVAAHKVPGFPLAKVGSDRNIDVSDVAVAAYFANFELDGDFRLSDGQYIITVLSGKLDV